MVHLHALYLKKLESESTKAAKLVRQKSREKGAKKNKGEEAKPLRKSKPQLAAKYTVQGFELSLQYWAYEAIPECGKKFAIKGALQFPRMAGWRTKGEGYD